MRKKDEAIEGGSEWSAPGPAAGLTPLDVQQKEFRVTRVGSGYRMREVDEFLDQITDTLTALVAENDRLRTSGGAVAAAPAGETDPSTTPSRTDPGAVDAFLQQEKGFLQDLGGLVQAHAEELRSMIRAARSEPAVPDTPTEPEAPWHRSQHRSRHRSRSRRGGRARCDRRARLPRPMRSSSRRSPRRASVEDDRDPDTITRVVADEPIRLEEPEPGRRARVGRTRRRAIRSGSCSGAKSRSGLQVAFLRLTVTATPSSSDS